MNHILVRVTIFNYRKIPNTSPETNIFHRPFLRGLFLEGFIFGGAYLRREICVSKSIGLACSGKEIYHFALFYFVFEGKFQVQAPGGAYIRRGGLTEGFLSYDFGGLIFSRGLYMEGLIFGILLYVVKSSPNKVFVYFCIKNKLQCVYNIVNTL